MFKGVKLFVCILPRKLCLFMGKLIGLAFYSLDKRHRLIALSNVKNALGAEFPSSILAKIACKSFVHFGKTLVDLIKFSQLDEEQKTKLITVEGEDNLDKALGMGKGILLFSAHYGNWEIAPFFLSKKGRFNVIARRLDNILLEKEIIKIRTKLGSCVIYKQLAARPTLQSLRAKEIVAILIDQNVLRNQAVFVDFFGKEAATTPSLAAFFLRTESPLVPAFCYPDSRDAYRIRIMEPLNVGLSGNYDQDVLKITQICTKIIEVQIREKPEYWAWFHNRWKTRPRNEVEQ
ncbi:MAG: lysophospholipid acyltransferase family protein [Candidatus Aminicenantaceae bacterium]